ncbi:FeoA family protein [Undibacterium sp.]|uniref:FeoA family protein n=1 Tax=Undibacterium sp. TaxID=1914977 RepID=UPI0025F51FA4|nr:FeoA family protein [Undibacterium sp.]
MNKLTNPHSSTNTLDRLKVGSSATVVDVAVSDRMKPQDGLNLTRRLKEIGFVKGESVRILHRGYFGGEPIAVRIGQSTFALRNFEAALIGIAPLGIA